MPDHAKTAKQRIQAVRDKLHGEYAAIQIVGRALTPEEERRSSVLLHTIEHLDQALEALAGEAVTPSPGPEVPAPEPAPPIAMQDGRYSLVTDGMQGDLRIDTGGSGIVSLDLFRPGADGPVYLLSARSNPGASVVTGQNRIGIISEDADDAGVTGTLAMTPVSDTQASVSITLDNPLGGLPAGVPVALSATWISSAMRVLGIEVDLEQALNVLPSYDFNGRTVTVDSCLEDAGFEISRVGERDMIPFAPSQGWDLSQLYGLMTTFADIPLTRQAWALNLMLLSESDRPGLSGIMFDSGGVESGDLPRQGAAVFQNTIMNHPAGLARKMIQTSVHELGHALNLAHRFEREVNRADSTSFMNYDWRYRGGGQSTSFWNDFQFTFDDDELRFLRHAPWPNVVPGGAGFRTIRYWSEGGGGYSPYRQEIPTTDLSLSLEAPGDGIYAFAQPVTMTVNLTNNTSQPMDLPRFLLDPKGSYLQVSTRKLDSGPTADAAPFHPIAERYYDMPEAVADVVPSGGVMSDNLNLTFGATGFSFAQPGTYEVSAVLAIPRNQDSEWVIQAQPVTIHVAYPQSVDEELDAVKIFRPDVGYYFALGGSDVLTEASEILEGIRERRMGKSKVISDPLVAHICRCQAINNARDSITYRDGEYHKRDARPSVAADLFGMIERSKEPMFDPATHERTRQLAKSIGKASQA